MVALLLLYIPSLIFATALIIVAYLLTVAGSFQNFKEHFSRKTPRITELPIITSTGQIVNSVEDLDMQLEFLESQLEEKEKELEITKSKEESTSEQLEKLTDTTNQIKKYYIKLKTDISRHETECCDLKNQIEDYKQRQIRLRDEVNANVKYYTGMLNNIDISSPEGYEMVKKASRSGK